MKRRYNCCNNRKGLGGASSTAAAGILLVAAAASVSLPGVANAFSPAATTSATTTGPYGSSRLLLKIRPRKEGAVSFHRPLSLLKAVQDKRSSSADTDTASATEHDESKIQQEKNRQPVAFDPLELSSEKDNNGLSTAVVGAATTSSSSSSTAIGTTTDSSSLSDNFDNSNEDKEGGGSAFGSDLDIWAARGLLLLVAVIWGTNFASVKYFEGLCFHPPCHHPPSEAAFARFGIAGLVSLPLLFKQRWDVIRAGLECGLSITLGYVSQAIALSTISSGKCAFICSLTVIVVPIFGALFYGHKAKITDIIAALIALAGVSVLEGMVDFSTLVGIKPALADTGAVVAAAAHATTSTTASAAASSSSIETAGTIATFAKTLGVGKGDIIALGQPLGFGYTFLRIEHYQEKFKDVPNRVLTIAAAQCVAVGILAFFWVLHDYNWTLPDFGYMIEPHRLVAIGWTGIVTTVVAIFLEGIALQTATATDAAITFSTEPVWACLFGYLLLHERLGTNSYIGGSIILLACLVGALSDMKQGQAEEEGTEAAADGGDDASSQLNEHNP